MNKKNKKITETYKERDEERFLELLNDPKFKPQKLKKQAKKDALVKKIIEKVEKLKANNRVNKEEGKKEGKRETNPFSDSYGFSEERLEIVEKRAGNPFDMFKENDSAYNGE